MSPFFYLLTILFYFAVLYVVARNSMRGKQATLSTFFLADKQAPWYMIAFAMIGTSISGVTFVSVPGEVGTKGMVYFQVALGYFAGYMIILAVLLPLYYRLGLTTIYQYLLQRFGPSSYRTGSFFFLLSQFLGSAARLFLTLSVLQYLVFEPLGLPFALSAALGVGLVVLYTTKGGLRTVILTDTVQTVLLLVAVCFTMGQILGDLGPANAWAQLWASPMGKVFEWSPAAPNFFLRDFAAGALIAIVMTGLDQAMMQKNLACANLRSAQANMLLYSALLVGVNFAFLLVGGLLFVYAQQLGIALPERGDAVYAHLAHSQLGPVVAITFLLGLVAAAYSSADGSMTSITTTLCVDFLGVQQMEEARALRHKTRTHLAVAAAYFAQLLLFNWVTALPALKGVSIISIILKLAGYTYAPLLGLYLVGLFTRWNLRDKWVPAVALAAPLLTLVLNLNSERWLGYRFGYELIVVNGLMAVFGLWLIRKPRSID